MGKPARRLDARQYMFACLGCFAVSWAISATVLLLRLTIMYAFDVVVQTRLDYSAEGAAEWARVVAEKDVGQAYEVWHLLNTSMLGLVYREPEDYTNLANVLAPAFDILPALHSVQLAFSDRPSELYVSRRKVALSSESSVLMQSTSTECFLLGPDGCVEQMEMAAPGQSRPQWYLDAEAMSPPRIATFQWASNPQIVVETNADSVDSFTLCIRLLFRAAFPRYPATVIGQVLMKTAALSGDRLVDSRLGEEGKIMLVDASGILLASRDPMDLLQVSNGIVHMNTIGTVDPKCGTVFQSASSSDSIASTQDDSNELIIVEPLRHSMQRFAIVVKAPSVTPFTNSNLLTTAILSAFVGPAPYVLALAVTVVIFGSQCVYSLRNSSQDPSTPTPAGGAKRISIEDFRGPSPAAKQTGWLTGFNSADVTDLATIEPKTPTVQGVKVAGKFPGMLEENAGKKAMDMERVHAAARMHKVMKELAEYEKLKEREKELAALKELEYRQS